MIIGMRKLLLIRKALHGLTKIQNFVTFSQAYVLMMVHTVWTTPNTIAWIQTIVPMERYAKKMQTVVVEHVRITSVLLEAHVPLGHVLQVMDALTVHVLRVQLKPLLTMQCIAMENTEIPPVVITTILNVFQSLLLVLRVTTQTAVLSANRQVWATVLIVIWTVKMTRTIVLIVIVQHRQLHVLVERVALALPPVVIQTKFLVMPMLGVNGYRNQTCALKAQPIAVVEAVEIPVLVNVQTMQQMVICVMKMKLARQTVIVIMVLIVTHVYAQQLRLLAPLAAPMLNVCLVLIATPHVQQSKDLARLAVRMKNVDMVLTVQTPYARQRKV